MKSQNTSFPGRILSRITRQAPSVSACLQASHSAQASLHCPALSNRKRIRKNPYLEQGAGPEEGRGGRQGGRKAGKGEGRQAGRCCALSRPCPAARQEHWSDGPSSGCFLRHKKGEDTATPVNCRVKGQRSHSFFFFFTPTFQTSSTSKISIKT